MTLGAVEEMPWAGSLGEGMLPVRDALRITRGTILNAWLGPSPPEIVTQELWYGAQEIHIWKNSSTNFGVFSG